MQCFWGHLPKTSTKIKNEENGITLVVRINICVKFLKFNEKFGNKCYNETNNRN